MPSKFWHNSPRIPRLRIVPGARHAGIRPTAFLQSATQRRPVPSPGGPAGATEHRAQAGRRSAAARAERAHKRMACPVEAGAEREAVQRSSGVSKRFRLMDRVIAGNFASTVLLGAARDNSAQVVVKVLMKQNLSSELERASAMAEVAIHSAMLPHPNILRLLASEDTPDATLLVTPFMLDGDLWSLMQYVQTYGETQVRHCAAQMLFAARHLHDVCRLIHADIKPHNFLLARTDSGFSLQLCDCGFSERPGVEGFVTFYRVRGTSGWFAPEMLQHKNYSFQIDLFGIGLIVFRMLGGYAPFDPPSRFQAACVASVGGLLLRAFQECACGPLGAWTRPTFEVGAQTHPWPTLGRLEARIRARHSEPAE